MPTHTTIDHVIPPRDDLRYLAQVEVIAALSLNEPLAPRPQGCALERSDRLNGKLNEPPKYERTCVPIG